MIYVFSDGVKFVNVKDMKLSITKNINKAAQWHSKKEAKTWESWIFKRKPTMKLRETVLILKEE